MRAVVVATVLFATLGLAGIACGTLLGISPDDTAAAASDAASEAGGSDGGSDGSAEGAVDAADAAACDADKSSDRDNCGACGTRCSQDCEAGACSKTVFLTSKTYVGDFAADGGAVAVGAAICNALAAAAGLRGTPARAADGVQAHGADYFSTRSLLLAVGSLIH